MSRTPTSFAPFSQQSFVVPANNTGYDNMLGTHYSYRDVDMIASVATINSEMPRYCVLVKNGSAAAIAAGAALNWVSGAWGTQVQACPVGQQIRGFAPGYVSGSTANTIPVGAYFMMVFIGPVLALNVGNSISVNDNLIVGTTAGSVNSDRTVFSSTAASAAITNTGTNTVFATNQYTFPANTLLAGDVIRLTGSCPITWATGTIRFQVLIGTTVVSDTQVYTPATGTTFSFDTAINILTIGASGTLTGSGTYQTTLGGTPTAFTALGSTAVDTTATQLVSVKIQWGTANAGNSVTLAKFQAQRAYSGGIVGAYQALSITDQTGTLVAARSRIRAQCQW